MTQTRKKRKPYTRHAPLKQYALYQGDDLLEIGDAKTLAKNHGIQEKTIHHYKTPAYQKRVAASKNQGNRVSVVSLDDE